MTDERKVIIGNMAFCPDQGKVLALPEWISLPIVHACKWPCFNDHVGKPRMGDPDYLWKHLGDNLYLNMIDPGKPFFMIEMFWEFLEWATSKLDAGTPVVIHCNEGKSRSPSLGMLLLVKNGQIEAASYNEAKTAFLAVYPDYKPGSGLEYYLHQNWDEILYPGG